jgi:hypothetical protein
MIDLEKNSYKKIHTRQIEVSTYDFDQNILLVEGRLKDDRFNNIYRPTGETSPPGTVHHMIIQMKVRRPEFTVEDIDVEMPTVPQEECPDTRTSLEPVKGMRITSGFTVRVKELVGGVKGCAHLVALLTAMAPAAIQGGWAAMAQKPSDPAKYFERTMRVVINTCRVWRANGPFVKKYRDKFKSKS